MTTMAIVSVVSLIVVFILSSMLILWCKYDDGIIGKGALIVLALAAFSVLIDLATGEVTYEPLASTAWTHAGFALFMVRHVFRFVRFRFYGNHSWRKAG